MKITFFFLLPCLISLFFVSIDVHGHTPETPSNDTNFNGTFSEQDLNLEEQYYTEGNGLFDAGKYADAVSSYDKALSINPSDIDVLYQKGRALNNIGKYDEAIITYDKVLTIDANYTDALKSKGITLD